MKVTINEREYELKKLSRKEARAYIQKDVYVWDSGADAPTKRKLLEVFQTDCDYPFCVLRQNGAGASNFAHCAAVPEEWYVYKASAGYFFFHCDAYPDYKIVDHGSHDYCVQRAQELNKQKEWYVIDLGKVVKGKRYHTTTTPSNFGVVDHGSEEYCRQKAEELNAKEMPCSECTHTYEPMVVCSGCDNKSKFERKETKEETREASAEHHLTNYELAHLLKCLGVNLCYNKEAIFNVWQYVSEVESKQIPDEYKIRYKRGNWMPATRETVLKWVEENKADMFDEVKYFVRFMGWDEDK